MTARDFCYWLQGFFELQGDKKIELDASQVRSIRAHLAMVFKHEIDHSMGDASHQSELNKIHEAVKGEYEKHRPQIGASAGYVTCPEHMVLRC